MADRITERDVLDALHARFCKPAPYGRPPRHVLAEHVAADNHYGRPGRTIDAVAIDRYVGGYAVHGTWDEVEDTSRGCGAEGIEIKVSQGDLRRELADLSKSGRFTESWLTHFTIAAPASVLTGWRDLGVPPGWGVLALTDQGVLRYLRRPTALRDSSALGIRSVAALAHAVRRTSTHCARLHPEAGEDRG